MSLSSLDFYTIIKLEVTMILFILSLEFIFNKLDWKKTSLYSIVSINNPSIMWDLVSVLIDKFFGFSAIFIYLKNISWISKYHYIDSRLAQNFLIHFVLLGFMFLLYDFLAYWWHRLMHQSLFLYSFHKFHHSSTDLNILLEYRSHYILRFIKLKTIFGIFFGTYVLGSGFFIFRSYIQYLSHAKIDYKFKILDTFFVTPRYHYVHHDCNFQNKNFAEVFVFWDKMFGTCAKTEISINALNVGIREDIYSGKFKVYDYIEPVVFNIKRLVLHLKRLVLGQSRRV